MRLLFGAIGLLVVLAVVGLLARQGLAGRGPAPEPAAPGAASPAAATQQLKQFQQALDAQMQQARPMPDDAR